MFISVIVVVVVIVGAVEKRLGSDRVVSSEGVDSVAMVKYSSYSFLEIITKYGVVISE